MEIVSVQSRVLWGYVGNSIAVPTIQSMGATVWPIDTVVLSHHPGHGPSLRETTAPDTIGRRLEDILEKCTVPTALIVGYLGNAEQGKAALETWNSLGRPGPVIIDPACGDDPGGLYVEQSIADFFAGSAVQGATIMTPNRFELETISGREVVDIESAIAACADLRQRGPSIVIATSIAADNNNLATVAVHDGEPIVCKTTLRETEIKGTGDLFTAAFTSAYIGGAPLNEALLAAVHRTDKAISLSIGKQKRYLDPLIGI